MLFRLVTITLSILLLLGCTAPLVPVKYSQEALITSSLPAYIEMNTGKVKGYSSSTLVYAGGVFVPVNSGPNPNLQFGHEDQSVFIESLKSELVGLDIIGSLAEDPENSLGITVNFVQTEHFPNMQEYKIIATLLLSFGPLVQEHVYEVLSSEGDSFWKKINTNAAQGKEKAAQKLIDQIIPHIEAFIGVVLDTPTNDLRA
ncbi:MAG: hypothetical protein AAF542_25570 [Pseudomonadota bacterium]